MDALRRFTKQGFFLGESRIACVGGTVGEVCCMATPINASGKRYNLCEWIQLEHAKASPTCGKLPKWGQVGEWSRASSEAPADRDVGSGCGPTVGKF
jgi:hypothetical protein